ncbi:UNKNOWN [Stylonychia lemnae]|uniref:Uncharacterized protein n=1 Tax=Stylonychia lemnae TaxID=5949 RepID=A0A078B696_STYLE|nr:UNKNOWN [Stylonychia lemnae]|eukprot:CDW89879.1 UNKNOWN [Stylonychia lemnae]
MSMQQQFMIGNTGGMNSGMPQQQQYIGGVNQAQTFNAQFKGLSLGKHNTCKKTQKNVPKQQIIRNEESATKDPAKKMVVSIDQDQHTEEQAQASNNSDPTHGKSKEFFLIYPDNLEMPVDPFLNPLMPNEDQMVFVFKYYPEYSTNPADVIIWLYQTAQFKEQEQARLQKLKQDTDGAYKVKPKIGARPDQGNRRNLYEEEEEYEEDSFYGFKACGMQKKPRQKRAPPSKLNKSNLKN